MLAWTGRSIGVAMAKRSRDDEYEDIELAVSDAQRRAYVQALREEADRRIGEGLTGDDGILAPGCGRMPPRPGSRG